MYLALQRYSRPSSADECLRLLAEPGQRAALLSGGTDLNSRDHESLTHVIDLQGLPLGQIESADGALWLGARLTLGQIRRHSALQRDELTALREAAAGLAVVALQNRSTLGGRIMVDRPDQDVPVALAALGARLHLLHLRGGKLGEAVIDYPIGKAARATLDGALVTAVSIPPAGGASALRRFGRTAVDVPLATCAAAVAADGTIRLAANQQGPNAAGLRRLTKTEAVVAKWSSDCPSDWRARARAVLLDDLEAYGDAWAGGEYRRDLSATLATRALAAVLGEKEIL